MSKTPVTAIFDIGKTNKKFFLFDEDLEVVYQTYHRLEPGKDEDGFQSEPIDELKSWMIETFNKARHMKEFDIKRINFTSYGATLVHTDENGHPVTPLYDYLKPFPEELLNRFYKEQGGKMEFCTTTASPPLAMLNSGLQLYFLKNEKPEQFKKIKHSFHLPQYLSSIFTGKFVSDFTSIGCHTGLWDFQKQEYHKWLKENDVLDLLLPAMASSSVFKTLPEFGKIPAGIGVHDSSSALLPYLKREKEPFMLLSTGTWAISINPFNKSPLTESELLKDCLQFIGITGDPIKISRLFIGEEHKYQVDKMYEFFKKPLGTYKKLAFEEDRFNKVISKPKRVRFHYLKPETYGLTQAEKMEFEDFEDFEDAYYSFLHELTELQIAALRLVWADSTVSRMFIDGGFNANEIFVGMLRKKLPDLEILTSDFALGTALGAALLTQPGFKPPAI
ncbi:FGGY family carbohydrate kinase [Algoriphagus sp.]|uniref:FGGY-family carbohydrate kinase n=1 Tax=Algoriphagus sp. TaxID=1872435 RepID=UPI0025EB2355|nr:FGGY family carbohydrate kinase [Algoriphagus sp.]